MESSSVLSLARTASPNPASWQQKHGISSLLLIRQPAPSFFEILPVTPGVECKHNIAIAGLDGSNTIYFLDKSLFVCLPTICFEKEGERSSWLMYKPLSKAWKCLRRHTVSSNSNVAMLQAVPDFNCQWTEWKYSGLFWRFNGLHDICSLGNLE